VLLLRYQLLSFSPIINTTVLSLLSPLLSLSLLFSPPLLSPAIHYPPCTISPLLSSPLSSPHSVPCVTLTSVPLPHTHIYAHMHTPSPHTLPTHPPHTGTIYGMGPALAAAKLGIDVASANRITHSFFNNYKQMKSWMMTIKRRDFFSLICNQIWLKCSYVFLSIIK
jgi:hypothetical protein